jgi:UDP-N-acetylmuramoylalanine--D-glutamate ligase
MRAARVGILGLARSGRAAARLARARGAAVFVSDARDTAELRGLADEIRGAGGEVELGGHTVERLATCDLLVLSPGVPPDANVLRDPRVRSVRRVSELEYAWTALSSPVIAITGTNGKSTTTALTAHLLQTAHLDAPAAGNIGLALSEIALRPTPPDWVVIEASSFQLADIETFAPRVGVVTNLSPDHLDRYPSVDAYYADKANLFRNAEERSTWVLNAEDPAVVALPGEAPGLRVWFRTDSPPGPGERGAYTDARGQLVLRMNGGDRALVPATELRIVGRHNRANALAAALAAAAAGAPETALAQGLRTFPGLEHRLERVADVDGVQWINDSKATNVASAAVALESMTRPVVLLLGGKPKGESFTPLLAALGDVRVVLAYGQAGEQIAEELGAHVTLVHLKGAFEDVVARAHALARPGDVVLLSPACASFDQFQDYEDRGRRFKALVAKVGRG